MGTIHRCPASLFHGRTCVNDNGQLYKDYTFIIEDTRTQIFVDGREHPIPGGWKAEIARGFKGYCCNCIEGRSEPLDMEAREDFLDDYLGEYDRWEREKEKQKKLAAEAEKLIDKIQKEKAESDACADAE